MLGLVAVTGVRAQDGPDLEARVSALETWVAALESTPIAVRAVRSGDALTFSDTGQVVSEPFSLPATHIVMTIESAGPAHVTFRAWPEPGFLDFVTMGRGGTASQIISLRDSGDYNLNVTAHDNWTVTIELP